jgi:hypothetical protein
LTPKISMSFCLGIFLPIPAQAGFSIHNFFSPSPTLYGMARGYYRMFTLLWGLLSVSVMVVTCHHTMVPCIVVLKIFMQTHKGAWMPTWLTPIISPHVPDTCAHLIHVLVPWHHHTCSSYDVYTEKYLPEP